jgi:hypothetical protein
MADLGLTAEGSPYGGAYSGIQQDEAAVAAAAAAADAGGAVQEASDGGGGVEVQQARSKVVVLGTDGGIYVR